MRVGRPRYWWIGLASAATATLLSACTAVAPVSLPAPGRSDSGAAAQPQAAATAAPLQVPARATAQVAARTPTPATTGSQGVPVQLQVPVRRGPVVATVQFDGRVSAAEEAPLSFVTSGTIATLLVTPGQVVTEGQVLLELESKSISAAIKDAQARANNTALQLQLAQTQSAAKQQEAQAQAQLALRNAQDNLSTVQAGSSAADRQAADQAVVNARAVLDKAQADQNKLEAGTSPADIAAAQRQIAADQLALRSAQVDKAKLLAGTDSAILRTAERDLANAQDALKIAQSELDTLTAGADPYEVRAAQREVDRAQAALTAAQSISGSGATQGQRDAAVAAAQVGVLDAQDRLARLKEPPRPAAVTAAKNKAENASAAVVSAQDRLDVLKQPPDQLSIDRANAAITSAQATQDNNQAKLAEMRNGASNEQRQAATSAVESAQLGLDMANARRDEVDNKPTPAVLAQAQRQVAEAEASLARLRSGGAVDSVAGNALQQKDIDQIRQQIDSLQSDLEATRLRAPFDGTIVSISSRQGDGVTAGKAVVSLANPGAPIVSITLPQGGTPDTGPPTPASRIAVGVKATVQVDGGDTSAFSGTISKITEAATGGGGRLAEVSVDWGSQPPPLGGTALVGVTIQAKSDGALADIDVDGKQIKQGQLVCFCFGAANRDPDQFPAPGKLDIARKPNRHLAFGHGLHYCVGAALARLEGQIAVNTVLRRLPGLRLETETLEWHRNFTLRGLKALPVVF